jgi:hypothetical protein
MTHIDESDLTAWHRTVVELRNNLSEATERIKELSAERRAILLRLMDFCKTEKQLVKDATKRAAKLSGFCEVLRAECDGNCQAFDIVDLELTEIMESLK